MVYMTCNVLDVMETRAGPNLISLLTQLHHSWRIYFGRIHFRRICFGRIHFGQKNQPLWTCVFICTTPMTLTSREAESTNWEYVRDETWPNSELNYYFPCISFSYIFLATFPSLHPNTWIMKHFHCYWKYHCVPSPLGSFTHHVSLNKLLNSFRLFLHF